MIACSTGWRHWFTVYGAVGMRAPVCQRCGAPNPRPLSEAEQRDYDAEMVARGRYRRENWR